MRKLTTLLLLLPFFTTAQTLVGTSPTGRTALLEEFTALHCGNCPAAHAVANNLAAQFGDDLTIIGVHGGGLAVPSAGQPDFRTTDGAAMWSSFGVSFQPQGMVNRQGLQQANAWSNSVTGVLAQTSPVNIGVSSTYDAGAQQITVMVELYYTDAPTTGDDRIHVALTEDHIIGWQTDYVNGNHPAYDHRHALRDLVTPLAGDPVTAPAVGMLVQRTYTLPIDASWNIANASVVAFVGDVGGAIHQVRSVEADGGATTSVPVLASKTELGLAFPVPTSDKVSFTVEATGNVRSLQLQDATGRIVLNEPVLAEQTSVSLSLGSLPEGLYFASFAGGKARRVVLSR